MNGNIFICRALKLALAAILLGNPTSSSRAENPPSTIKRPPPVVVVFQDPTLVQQFKIDEPRTESAIDQSVAKLLNEPSPKEAWARLFKAGDKVSIHFTATGEAANTPPHAILEKIVRDLLAVGVSPDDIVIWDKMEDALLASQYTPGEKIAGAQVEAVVPGAGFDPSLFYFNEIAGKLIWGDHDFVGKRESPADLAAKAVKKDKDELPDPKPEVPDQISNKSYFTNLVTQADKIINVSILTDHPDLGIYGASASLAMSSVDNNRRFYNDNVRGDPAIGEILTHKAFKNKVVLHIMLGLIAQYAGGPTFRPHYTNSAGLILVGQDPVAIDTIALQYLEQWREDSLVIPIGSDAKYLKSAAALGAGTCDLKKIVVIHMGKGTSLP